MPRSVSSHVRSPQATLPRRGLTSPAITRSTLLLPAPDGPASATHWPGSMFSATAREKSPSSVSASIRSIPAPDELGRQQDGGGHRDQHRGQRQRVLEVAREALVDRERGGLRDALERAGEHQRGAELSERAAERERAAGDEPGRGGRDRDAHERPRLGGSERARGG